VRESKPVRYLLRLDDLCPTMDAGRWQCFFALIDEFALEPILAVVPDNRDPDLDRSPADPEFWPRLRALEAQGAAIVLHGLHHQSLSSGRSLIPLHRKTEFAGVPFDRQRAWMREGLGILRAQKLHPQLWVAPRHGFDRDTLRALDAEGIGVLSDGFARVPFTRYGLVWLPQQLWAPREKSSGVWTICMHPNTATEEQVEELRGFLVRHGDKFISVDQALISFPPKPYGLGERLFAVRALGRIRIAHVRKVLRA